MLIFAPEIVAVALQHGRFSTAAAQLTTAAIRGYSLGLFPLFVATLCWRVLQVRRNLVAVVVVGAVFFFVTLATAVPFFKAWGLFGIGAANTAGAVAAMVLAVVLLFRGQREVRWPATATRSLWRLSIALGVMAVIALAGSRGLVDAPAWLRLGFAIIVPPGAYLGLLYLLRLGELRELGMRRRSQA
jgi:peptidoglycan biosynthesis protein MviN/MurJ (putative lipid II flippase)